MILGFVDVETTGLKAQEHRLLELAILLYRWNRTPVENEPNGLLAVHHHVFHLSKVQREGDIEQGLIDPVVREMHTNNGLFVECELSYAYPSELDASLALQLPAGTVLVGRNVHLDNDFLRRHLPETAQRFSHRHLDLTTVDYLRGRQPRPASTHRALHDAMAELLELTSPRGASRPVIEDLAG